MKMIRSVIADDEQGCITNLQFYLKEYCPKIEILRTESKPSAIPALLKEDIDIAFLDIEICKDNIFHILQQTGPINFDIVFVTAHEKYSLRAFNVDVLDYLLKPLKKDAIVSCYHKILKRFDNPRYQNDADSAPVKSFDKNVILKQGNKVYVVALKDIVYIEAKGAYTDVCVYQQHKKNIITVSKSLTDLTAGYAYADFHRVHRSFVINKSKVDKIYKHNCIQLRMCTGDMIPVARRRWSDYLSIANT